MTLFPVLLVASIALVLAGPARAEQTPLQEVIEVAADSDAGKQIVLAPLARKRIAGRISATATVEPDARAVAHITSRIPARVVKLIADPGQLVAPGQPLALVNSLELGQAKTEYLKARSLKDIAAQHLKREQELHEKKIAPLKDLLEARANHDTALAQYEAAREALRLLVPPEDLRTLDWSRNGVPLSEFPLSSPIAGTLVRRNLTIGETIDRDHEPMTVINLDHVWVLANVFEHDLAALRIGAIATVTVDAYPARNFDGHVFFIADEIDRATRTVQARIEVPNPGHLLKPGMFAHAEIEGERASREVPVAPESAIYDLRGEKVIFVSAGPNRFAVRSVTLGSAGDGAVEILSGLRSEDQVVIKGGLPLKALMLSRPSR